jgi:triphosphoribosyl-dephospho-CoA synthase
LPALREARRLAREFLAAGGGLDPQAPARAARVHAIFVARRWSPGGAADLLAAACLVERMELLHDGVAR